MVDRSAEMLDHAAIERAVDLSQRGYALIQWLADGVKRGFISIGAAHSYASLPAAAREWVAEHYENLPLAARPPKEELPEFCNLFSTYLEGSFDLRASPGKRLYSPGAHCFCPMCSWLVDIPHLQAKRPSRQDKKRAQKLLRKAILSAAHAEGVTLTDESVDEISEDPSMREPVALCAYASDLLRRLGGESSGPAQLVLWRTFAWEPSGSPKKGFRLTAQQISDAELNLRARVKPVG